MRPFLILANLDESLNPVSGNIVDVAEAKSISSLLVLEDENGYTVIAGAQNWIFVFKVSQNQLHLIQKYNLLEAEAESGMKVVSNFSLEESGVPHSISKQKKVLISKKKFSCTSMVYLNSCIFVLDKESSTMIQIRMDNYRPTRPSSLSFNRWRLESSFAEL